MRINGIFPQGAIWDMFRPAQKGGVRQKWPLRRLCLFHTNFYIVLIFLHEIFITNESEIKYSIQWLSQFFYILLYYS
jgi:hypothetical protein